MNYQSQNQYPYKSNTNDQLNFNQFGNSEDFYNNSKEEEIKTEINTTIRLGFIRKVYGILCIQLFVTTIVSLISMASSSVQKFMVNHQGIMLFMFLLIIILPIIIVCCPGIMRQVPQNYIILSVFTFAESYLIGFICAFTKPEIVFMAAVMTFIMVVSLTLYAINTSNDITMQGGLIFIFGAAMFLFCMFSFFTRNSLFSVIISLFCVVLFSLYIIYDTQLIMGNRQEMIQLDDYILGAFMIYTDIIGIFLELLKIFSYFYDS